MEIEETTAMFRDFLTVCEGDVVGSQPLSPMESLIDNHQRALAAQRSTIERMIVGHTMIAGALAERVLAAVVTQVEAIEAMLACRDPNARFGGDVDAFAERFIGKLFDNALKMVEATGESVTLQAGDDVRREDGSDETSVDRFFGATVLPSYTPVLRPVKGGDGRTRYAVEDPSGFNR